MPELTEAQAGLLSDARGAAQRALRRIVVDAARASKLPSLTTEQRAEWRERAEVWAAAAEFASDLVAPLPDGAVDCLPDRGVHLGDYTTTTKLPRALQSLSKLIAPWKRHASLERCPGGAATQGAPQ